MKRAVYFICAALMAGAVRSASAGSDGQLGALYRINSETEAKIQAQVLDRMLGPGKASVFLETKAEIASTIREESKDGTGTTRVRSERSPAEGGTEALKPGREKEDRTREQMASQGKKSVEENNVFHFVISSMKARILHDASVPSGRLQAVKDALPALYPSIKPADIVFVPALFEPVPAR